MSVNEIARELGISHQRVTQLYQKAIRKLRTSELSAFTRSAYAEIRDKGAIS